MRFALCDDDQLFTTMIEVMLSELGHEVVGVCTTTPDSVALVRTARPDVVIVELALGFNTDFDIVDAAALVGATTIVFSRTADEAILARYPVRPRVVEKPDLAELERQIRLLDVADEIQVPAHDRRQRPARGAAGLPPTNVRDAQTFYESLNQAEAGDVLVSIEIPATGEGGEAVAARVRVIMRDTDRLLASPDTVRVYLPAGDDVGARSFRARLAHGDILPDGAGVRVVVLGPDEAPGDAFDRLKSAAPEPY